MLPLLPEHQLNPIREALFRGEKITAIKLYREAMSSGLAEAKEAIEKFESELRDTSPAKFTAPPADKGCMGVIVMCFAIVMTVISWLSLG